MMLRRAAIACFAIFIITTADQTIPEDYSAADPDIRDPSIPISFKTDPNIERFLSENSEAIRQALSEQDYAQPQENDGNNFESTTVSNKENDPSDVDEETKNKCKYYYRLFQQNDRKLKEAKGEHAGKFNTFPDSDFAQTSNFERQSLPHLENFFFNVSPEKNSQKPNSKGPLLDSIPMTINNGYQYFPVTSNSRFNQNLNYLEPPHERKYVEFLNNHQQYSKLPTMTLQDSLVTDGKTLYIWYKPMLSHEIPVPIANAKSGKLDELHEDLTSTTTTTTTTQEPITTSTVENIKTTKEYVKDMKQLGYEHQLKFVYSIPYPKQEVVDIPAYGFDPYAYYPREFHPKFVNVPVPYVPSYQMIKHLTVPNEVYRTETNTANPGK